MSAMGAAHVRRPLNVPTDRMPMVFGREGSQPGRRRACDGRAWTVAVQLKLCCHRY